MDVHWLPYKRNAQPSTPFTHIPSGVTCRECLRLMRKEGITIRCAF